MRCDLSTFERVAGVCWVRVATGVQSMAYMLPMVRPYSVGVAPGAPFQRVGEGLWVVELWYERADERPNDRILACLVLFAITRDGAVEARSLHRCDD